VKIKRSQVIFAVIVALVVVYYGWWIFASGDVFHSSQQNASHRAALVRIHEAVSVGSSHSDVLSAYWQSRTDSLRLIADTPSEWVITMPLEFGATDWKLVIDFQNDKVSAVRVRTSDGPPPAAGPQDKQNN
jgi:hypothetical protein